MTKMESCNRFAYLFAMAIKGENYDGRRISDERWSYNDHRVEIRYKEGKIVLKIAYDLRGSLNNVINSMSI